MPVTYYAIMTALGLAKVAAFGAGGPVLSIAQVAVGDSNGLYYNPTGAEVALVHEVWRGNKNRVYIHPNNPNWMIVEAIIPANAGGFDVREAVAIDSAGEVIAIAKYPLTNKPAPGSGAEKEIYLRMIFQLANTAAIEQTIDATLVMATQQYVDTRVPRRVRAAATGAVVLAGTFNVDGVELNDNDEVLLPFQADSKENGIYQLQAGALVRAPGATSSLDLVADLQVLVSEGAVNADTVWLLTTNAPITLGTSALSFTRIYPDEATRTVDDSLAPAADQGAPSTIFGWLAHMIKAITGKASWRTAPAITLEAAGIHVQNTENPHEVTADQTGAWPIGSWYFNDIDARNPNVILGFGTWVRVCSGRMPLGAGGEYEAGQTGGQATVTLTPETMPEHDHPINFAGHTSLGTNGGGRIGAGGEGPEIIYDFNTGSTGGGEPHDNMSPYLVVNIWRRTA